MPTLEERIAKLEIELKALQNQPKGDRPWWEERFGAFANDPFYDAAVKAGTEYRKSQVPSYLKAEPSDDVRP